MPVGPGAGVEWEGRPGTSASVGWDGWPGAPGSVGCDGWPGTPTSAVLSGGAGAPASMVLAGWPWSTACAPAGLAGELTRVASDGGEGAGGRGVTRTRAGVPM